MSYTYLQFKEDFTKIKTFCKLSPDWDSYGSLPPSLRTVDSACEFLLDFFHNDFGTMIRPGVSPLSGRISDDVGVNLAYLCANGVILIDFYGGGEVCAASSGKFAATESMETTMDKYRESHDLLDWIQNQIMKLGGPRDQA